MNSLFLILRSTSKIIGPGASPSALRAAATCFAVLLRGARTPEERQYALDLAANLRLYSPTERIWLESGDLVARIALKKGYERRKIQELSLDVLIGLTARANGAAVITVNRQDFEDLRDYRRCRLIFWE